MSQIAFCLQRVDVEWVTCSLRLAVKVVCVCNVRTYICPQMMVYVMLVPMCERERARGRGKERMGERKLQ